MNNRRTVYAIAAAWTMFWLLMIATAVQDFLRDGGQGLWKPVLWESSSAVVATLLLALQRRFTRRHDHLLGSPLRWFGMQLLWAPVYWLGFVPLAFGIRHGVYALAGETYEHEDWLPTLLYEDVKISVFFGIFVVIQFGLLSYRALMEEKLRAEQANALLRQAQLQQLTQQMQPHFLFNALNTISSLMHTDVERADATLIQLADVLRATLEHSGRQLAPLSTELRLLRGYAHLMSERYTDRVRIAWHIDEAMHGCEVPLMSLQPLLENVFKHTVERRRQPTRITIAALRDGGELVLRVEDDSGRLEPERATDGGIGLRNLRERLTVLHGGAASLRLLQLEPAGVRAEMRLPCAC
ncbi:sensor histidine kinase [Pseudoduganella namucuonensis]|uniref:Histidine kinase n=1 Tax=Pseudoduganella namucuonensis TaxID=1035707 RepID=A0A1I7JFY2_9BURK|nr:histidine kinase [Pseudoduganella namucuonensis]SFU84103.1 Histidine kinase [Pseudoduganella namucuonensis]